MTPGEACSAEFTKTAECWFYQGLPMAATACMNRLRPCKAFKDETGPLPKPISIWGELRCPWKLKEAQEPLKRRSRLARTTPTRMRILAQYFGKLNQHDNAIRTLKKAIALNPEDAALIYNLGAELRAQRST